MTFSRDGESREPTRTELERAVKGLVMAFPLAPSDPDVVRESQGKAQPHMRRVRDVEGKLGYYLGRVPGSSLGDIKSLVDTVRDVTNKLIVLGAVRHVDHFDQTQTLSLFGAMKVCGWVERLELDPLATSQRALTLTEAHQFDPELRPPQSSSGADTAFDVVVEIKHSIARHLGGELVLDVQTAVDALTFFVRLWGVLTKCEQVIRAQAGERKTESPPHSAAPPPRWEKAMTLSEFSDWCRAVLEEVQQATAAAKESFRPADRGDSALAYGRGSDLTDRESAGRRFDQIRDINHAAHLRFIDEPFMLRVETRVGDQEPAAQVYCISRGSVSGVSVPGVRLVSARAKMGILLRSLEPGAEGSIEIREEERRVQVVRRAEIKPNGASEVVRDAVVDCGSELHTRSARQWLARLADSSDMSESASGPSRGPTSDRRRSFELYDQLALYKAQHDVLESDFRRPLLLLGAAGTGKTTGLIKRLVDVVALGTEDDEGVADRRAELGIADARADGCALEKWVMIVPHSDWVRYAQSAFRGEGLRGAGASQIRTWESLRGELHRRQFDVPTSETKEGESLQEVRRDTSEVEEIVVEVVEAVDRELTSAASSTSVVLDDLGRRVPGRTMRPLADDAGIEAVLRFVGEAIGFLTELDLDDREGAEAVDGPDEDQDHQARLGTSEAAKSAVTSLRRIRRAQRRWLEAVAAVQEAVKKRDLLVPGELTRDLAFFVALRNARLAHQVWHMAGARGPFAKEAEARLDLTYGHVYVDEFENRTLLELATLAALTHPSAGAVVFSGDSAQATEVGGTPADQRARKALELARLGAAREIRFERRVRQCSRLAAASDRLRDEGAAWAEINVSDPEIRVAIRVPPEQWGGWATDRVGEILARSQQPVTLAVITASKDDGANLVAHMKGAKALGIEVRLLDAENRPAGPEAAIYVVSLEEPHILHGLEFEGALLMGVDRMLALPQGRQRVYVAMTRAANYLGIVSEGELPDELAPILEVAEGSAWTI